MDKFNHLTDQELVEKALAEPESFAFLIWRYEDRLRRYIGHLSNLDEAETDDCLQEVFIKVYKNLKGYKPELSFSAWVYRITHNQVISRFRSHGGKPPLLSLDDEETLILADSLDLSEELDGRLLAEKITKTLSCLAPSQREILTLKFLEQKSYEEIADILQKPMGTVATLIHKAKAEFRKQWL